MCGRANLNGSSRHRSGFGRRTSPQSGVDRGGCEWAGFGIGWDVGSPKTSEIMDKAAVEFKIRSVEAKPTFR